MSRKVIAEQGLNIDTIKRLTGRIPLDSEDDSQNRSCIEFSVRGTPKCEFDSRKICDFKWRIETLIFHFKKIIFTAETDD